MVDQRDLLVVSRIQTMILERLQDSGFTETQIPLDMPILGKGLGLDSIEAVTLALDIEAEFGILIGDDELTADLFRNLGTLSDYVQEKLS